MPSYAGQIRIAVADNNEEYRDRLSSALSEEPGFEVLVSVSSALELLGQLKITVADVILMEIKMPVMDGLEYAARILAKYPETKIVLLTACDFEQYLIELCFSGAKSFIGKSEDFSVLFRAVRIVSEGGIFWTDTAVKFLKKYLGQAERLACPMRVTESELKLLRLICDGMSSTEIAKCIFKSPRTVEKYRTDLYDKFSAGSKEELIKLCAKWGLV